MRSMSGRREDLALHDRGRHVRRVAREVLDAGVGVALAVAGRPLRLLGGAVLGEHRHHVAAVVGERGVDGGRQLGLHVGIGRRAAGERVLPGRLEVVDRGAEVDAGAVEHRLGLRVHALVARGLGEDHVDLHRAAAGPVAAHVGRDLVREVVGSREVEHGGLGMGARGDDRVHAAPRRPRASPPRPVRRGRRCGRPRRRCGSTAPAASAERAIAFEIAPMPPIT